LRPSGPNRICKYLADIQSLSPKRAYKPWKNGLEP
jgi:hypothetical protein